MDRKRRKYLEKNPKAATAREIEWMLNLVHEVRNLKSQVGSLTSEITRLNNVYAGSVFEAQVKAHKIESEKGKAVSLKKQINLLGNVLDNERKLIPADARKKLKPLDKPGDSQLTGVGPYITAPTAETL